jgi:hypothetical protein
MWIATDMQDRADRGDVVYEQRGSRPLIGILVAPVRRAM